MKIQHRPHHWIVVALALVFLLTLSEVHGQSSGAAMAAITERLKRGDVKPGRDQSIAKDQRSATRKVKKAAKRTITRGRHGVSDFDSASTAAR